MYTTYFNVNDAYFKAMYSYFGSSTFKMLKRLYFSSVKEVKKY
jgi:hypothetical protein